MTVTLERPVGRVWESKLADDIRYLIDNLYKKIYNIIRDYQETFCSEVILIDDNKNHCQIEIHDTGKIELLQQKYLPSGKLLDIGFTTITSLPEFTKLIQA